MATQVQIPGWRILRVAPLALLIPLLVHSPSVSAVIIDGVTLDIDSTTPLDSYELRNAATLNAQNATTDSIFAQNGSTVNFTGGAVVGTGTGVAAVNIAGSFLNLSGAQITGLSNRGLALSTVLTGEGSQALVTDSIITGSAGGVSVTSESTLAMINSSVTGTGAGSFGLLSFSGTIHAQGGSITGAGGGISIRRGANRGELVLDGTQVTGQTGSAIELLNRSV